MARSFVADNGGEYLSDEFQNVCDTHSIKRELIVLRNPTQNGVTERMNCTIQEKIQSMLSHAHLLDGFWAEALMIAVHLINRSPNHAIDCGILEEIRNGRKPLYDHLRVFGCEAYVADDSSSIGQNGLYGADMHDEQQVEMSLRRLTRMSQLPERFVPGVDYVMSTNYREPSCYKEAMLRDVEPKWGLAMQSKMDSLSKNDTFLCLDRSMCFHASGCTK